MKSSTVTVVEIREADFGPVGKFADTTKHLLQ